MKPKSTFLFFILLAGALLGKAQTFTSVDINSGADSSFPTDFAALNGKLIFQAATAASGQEPFVSDGTPGGTSILADIWSGAGNSYPHYFTAWNNKVYFVASDSVHGYQIWTTDGTPAGTSMLVVIGNGAGWPYYFTPLNGKLYFGADDSIHGYELWVTDGTAGGTSLVKDIWPGTGSGDPGDFAGFTVTGSKLYFDADDSVHGTELWESDGTTAGTQMVLDIWPGIGSSSAGQNGGFFAFNNKLYFDASDSVHGDELWVSDGTPGGTSLVKDIWPGTGGSYAGYSDNNPAATSQFAQDGFTAYNGKFYFEANDSTHGYELWSSDGTTGGTNMVADIYPGDTGSLAGYEPPVVYNGLLYVPAAGNANANGYNRQIWVTDGTAGGTHVVTNINPSGSAAAAPYPPYRLIVQGNLIYFIDVDSVTGNQLYSTNGTDTGTHMLLPPIAPNTNPLGYYYNGDFEYLYPFNNGLAYAAGYTSIGYELWFYIPPAAAIGSVNNLPALQVYPNPFSGQLMLQGLSDGIVYDVSVSDIQGRTVSAQRLTATGNATALNIGNISSGVYLLRLSNGDNAITVKVVKQ